MCSSACLKQHLHIKQSTYRLQLSAAITEGLSARDLHYMQITSFCKHFFLLHVIISGLPIQQFFWSSQSVSEAYLISWYWLQTTDSFTDSFCDSYNNSHSAGSCRRGRTCSRQPGAHSSCPPHITQQGDMWWFEWTIPNFPPLTPIKFFLFSLLCQPRFEFLLWAEYFVFQSNWDCGAHSTHYTISCNFYFVKNNRADSVSQPGGRMADLDHCEK